MSQKRSRALYESGQAPASSPYAVYGTPLPPADSRDDGSFVPLWKQEVVDERGRKRLHGAFRGGFSAGYFNTVGSREGWTPKAFVSSRDKRAKAAGPQQRVEDFMDEEDLAEADEARKVQGNDQYMGFGFTDAEKKAGSGDKLMDLLMPQGDDTIGVKLLKRMGWKPGQGIGPRRKIKVDMGNGEGGVEKEFAPVDSIVIRINPKTDRKGLGFEGIAELSLRDKDKENEKTEEKEKPRKGAFGVGVLNDTGSDDEDPYEIGPKISYNRVIGGDKKLKKKKTKESKRGTLGAMKGAGHMFVPKILGSTLKGFRKCHDGRLPLDGFVLSEKPPLEEQIYPPPDIPRDWKSAKSGLASDLAGGSYQTNSQVAKDSTLDPSARAKILGEEQLKGKSVFDFLTPEARNRIAAASGRTDLPAAGSENVPASSGGDPVVEKEAAILALDRLSSGWTPYEALPEKAERYEAFLRYHAGLLATALAKPKSMSAEDFAGEVREFAAAAQLFRPLTGGIAKRFHSSTSNLPPSNDEGSGESLVRKPTKRVDEAAEAARMGLWGPLTRTITPFVPSRLLCKRFNVKPPESVVSESADAEDVQTSTEEPTIGASRFKSSGYEIQGEPQTQSAAQPQTPLSGQPVDAREDAGVNINPALEGQRPGEAVFRAIFGDSDSE